MIKKILKRPLYYLILFIGRVIPKNKFFDSIYLKMIFKYKMKRKLNLVEPKTYNEKLQWLKLNDRNPSYTKMVDKFEAKEYVKNIIGEEYIIPTLGVWDNFDDIDFDKLPNQFVLKCTHDSGGLIICKDKANLDLKNAKRKIEKSLKTNYYLSGREWPYKNVKPRIIAEQYMEDKKLGELRDYKFFCFNGHVKFMFVASDRGIGKTKFDFFDNKFNRLPIEQHYPNSDKKIDKPKNYEKMIELAEKISGGINHVRVDFYESNNNIYFGEITFYHFSGLEQFNNIEWDYKFGEDIEIK